MRKRNIVKIKDLWNVEISNEGDYGHKLLITFTGRNSRGKETVFKIDADMYFAKHLAHMSKKAVIDFKNRAIECENSFNKLMNEPI
jgi:hypothetical protein